MDEGSINALLTSMNNLNNVMGPSKLSVTIIKHLEESLSMFERCPFNVDDVLELTHTPVININTNWSWLNVKHLMIPGLQCKVVSRKFTKGLFWFSVEIENISGTYLICENLLKKS